MFNRISSLFSSPSQADTEAASQSDRLQTSENSTQAPDIESMKPRTLGQMLQYRARLTPDVKLLSYPKSKTEYVSHTAAQINQYVEKAAAKYAEHIPPRLSSTETPKTVALLGVADLTYVISMFALYRLGYTVVAHSPRLAKEAHEHLLNEMDTHHVLYHESLSKMANTLGQVRPDLQLHQLAGEDVYMSQHSVAHNALWDDSDLDMDIEGQNLAVVIHSSGSTGLPKPTRLSHDTLIMAASKNMNMRAFSCVPFFHGFGLNGLHRGLYAGQEFYFYNASLPLTSKHLIHTIINHDFEIFFCVPYALKLLAETDEGVQALKKCKLVWFAGSACPDDLGDALTDKGIRLVSDYGLSECGPLMTTMRPHNDNAWNYLRPLPHNKPYMKFEEREEGNFELVCLDGMPWKVAENREDHSYATKDIFEKHPTIEHAYRFITRQDDTLVLSNGEKANPSSLEGKIRQHKLVAEAIVFGSGRTELGLLLIKSQAAEDIRDSHVIDKVWSTIVEAQKEMPEHARLVKSMVVVLPASTEYPKTDKGTIIRQQVYKKFEQEIENAYSEDSNDEKINIEGSELHDFVRNEIASALNLDDGDILDDGTDLFSLGIDSLQSTQLRRKIQSRIDLKGNKLPINFVYENPTIQQLCSFIMNLTSGQDADSQKQRPQDMFESLVKGHGNFSYEESDCDQSLHYVVLTGSTGSLGAHLLKLLLQNKTVGKVYCLVRASSPLAASERITKSLQSRKLYTDLTDAEKAKVLGLPSQLASEHLGLNAATYQEMTLNATAVIHAAWPVNFSMSLASFQSDVVGTKNLLDLCLSPSRKMPASFTFCSSISTSMNVPTEEAIAEVVPSDLTSALSMGYAQSKLAAEHLCIRAVEQTGLKGYVMRIGQIVGDTQCGLWNATEAIPMMIQTSQTTGTLPNIEEVHKWLPVDIVARSILEICLPAQAPAGTVFNIVNPSEFKWKSDLLPKLRNAGLQFQEASAEGWLEKLRSSDMDAEVNPPVKLLTYFESAYGDTDARGRGEEHIWEVENASRYSSTFAQGWHISESAVQQYVDYWQTECWNNNTDTHRSRQASWSSENTLGNEEEVEKLEECETEKASWRKEMYADLSPRDRADSSATLKTDTLSADKFYWNPKQTRFGLQNADISTPGHGQSPEDDEQACYVKVDMNAMQSGKVLAWTGTQFELRKPGEVSSVSQAPQLAQQKTSSRTLSSEDPVMVPKEGELLWDAETRCFAVGSYKKESEAIVMQGDTDAKTEIDIDAISQPKEVVWDGTKIVCC